MAHPYWPLFDLRIRTARLELRIPTDDDVVELIDAAKTGIHDPAEMPFSVAWTDIPSPRFEQQFLQHYWTSRGALSAEHWSLPFAIAVDGRLIGAQDIRGDNFAITRQLSTGSWLRSDEQGKGYGKEMRAAVLHFAFDTLGAEIAYTAAFAHNVSSQRVTEALGYEFNGLRLEAPRGEPQEMREYRLTRAKWEAGPRIDVVVEGADDCFALLGLGPVT